MGWVVFFFLTFCHAPSNNSFYEGLKRVGEVSTSKLELRFKRSLKTENKFLKYIQVLKTVEKYFEQSVGFF